MIVCERHGRIRCDECAFVDELKERITELQEALEWYADVRKYHHIENKAYSKVIFDEGETARRALERGRSQ